MTRIVPFCATISLTLVAASGCMVPKSRLDACNAFNCQLQRKNQEVCSLYENLRLQNQELANKNLDMEDRLAAQEELIGGYERRRDEWDREREDLRSRYASMLDGQAVLPTRVRHKLEDFAQRYPDLVDVDPNTGISKFKSDVLFDSGEARLRPESLAALKEFANIFQDPSGRALQIAVVGHTDVRQIRRPETMQRYESNWDLSSDRANAVVKYLQQSGIEPRRMASIGYGPYQPLVNGSTPEALAKNRRVEIFVLAPDNPMVGRTAQGNTF